MPDVVDGINLTGIPSINAPTPPSPPGQEAVDGINLTGLPTLNPQAAAENQNEEQYGTVPQQALTIGEGLAQGVLGPIAPALEEGTGLTTGADIRARAATNPIEHGVAEAGSFIGSLFVPGLGENSLAGQVGNIGEHAAALTGLGGEGAGTLSRIAGAGVRGAAEMAAVQSSDELTKLVEGAPDSVGSAAINVGLAGILGGLGGAAIGSVSPLWDSTVGDSASKMIGLLKGESTADGIEPKTLIESLTELKPNAPEIKAAADTLGAPLLESQVSASKRMQEIDSYLINSSNSPIGNARQALLQSGITKAEGAVSDALGPPTGASQVEVGNAIKASLTQKIEAEAAPINELYDTLKQSTGNIPVSNNAKGQIAANIRRLEDYKFTNSPVRSLGDSVIENLPSIETVDDIKRYKTLLNQSVSPTAPPGEKYAVGIIAQKLTDLEENTITRAAQALADHTGDPELKETVLGLLDQRRQANAAYTQLRSKMSDLGEVLGKKRIGGPQDFLNFIDDLTPEKLTTKLFSKNNSEALASFANNFPEEMSLIVQYQKAALREAATTDGVLSVGKVNRELDKLSPEVKNLMFKPEEIGKLQAAKTYVESIPKSINPSGTAKTHSLLKFFSNPISAATTTAADFGMKKLLTLAVPMGTLEKTVGAAGTDTFLKSVYPAMEENVLKKEANPGAFKAGADFGANVIKGNKIMTNSVRNFFVPGAEIIGKHLIPDGDSRDKLQKSLDHFQASTQNAMNTGGDIGHYLPNQGTAVAQTAAMASNYLSALKPKISTGNPLDIPAPINTAAQVNYNRALDLAQQPLLALHHAKNGTLLPQDVQALQAMYPGLHSAIASNLQSKLIEHTAAGNVVPYNQRIGLNMLLGGTPLDGTMNPANMQAIIAANAPALPPQMSGKKGKRSGPTSAALEQIDKTASLYQTPQQARQADRRA